MSFSQPQVSSTGLVQQDLLQEESKEHRPKTVVEISRLWVTCGYCTFYPEKVFLFGRGRNSQLFDSFVGEEVKTR
jgi:hypothetical protein